MSIFDIFKKQDPSVRVVAVHSLDPIHGYKLEHWKLDANTSPHPMEINGAMYVVNTYDKGKQKRTICDQKTWALVKEQFS